MGTGRLEAFTDGVLAVVITIIVLDLKVPSVDSLAGLAAILPLLLTYALSFANIGIFWNNHHHMLHLTQRINGTVLWANLFLLFWLSLVPFVIRWMDESGFSALSTAAYGFTLAMSSVGYVLLERAIAACNERSAALTDLVGKDRKSLLSLLAYLAAIPLAFASPWISIALYVASALMWLIPDRRIEAVLLDGSGDATE